MLWGVSVEVRGWGGVVVNSVLYTRVSETSAGGLRSIYLSLGMRQFLVTSQWASVVTNVRPNLMTFLYHGDKMIPDAADLRLESFHPPFVAGIDLQHRGVLDSYD